MVAEQARTVRKFDLGEVVVSSGATSKLTRDVDIDPALQLHLAGYWGDQAESRLVANDKALSQGEQLQSVFHSGTGVCFTVVTDLKLRRTFVFLTDENVDSSLP